MCIRDRSTPASRSNSRRVSSGVISRGQLSGRRIRNGCGSKVTATDREDRAAALSLSRSRTVSYTHLDVYKRQLEDGVITNAQANAAKAAPLGLHIEPPSNSVAPWFVEDVRRELERQFGSEQVHEEGLRVYTCLLYTSRCV